MKNLILIIISLFSLSFSFAQEDDFQDDYFREKVNLEFNDNYSKCYLSETKKAVSESNGKMEFWSICNLDNKNRIIRIESYDNAVLYQEVYFELNGKLRYSNATEYYIPKKGFSEMTLTYDFYFENEKLVAISFGNVNSENFDSSRIIGIYKNRISELEKMKK
ncbi:hypothetical protein WNY78_06195 [Psychroserpens sp. AS72]|uniref:hypothetical protein n=1 Tax=Psychroserpens sp. AS72 TaxID=3135775 RepID=UPI003172DC58